MRGCWGQHPSSGLVIYPGHFLEESERGSLEGWLDPRVKQDRKREIEQTRLEESHRHVHVGQTNWGLKCKHR